MKVAICQTNPIIGDFEYNVSLAEQQVDRAKNSGCELVIFPEMSLTGYPPKDLLERPAFVKENLDRLAQFAAKSDGVSVVCGYIAFNPKPTGKRLVNGAAFIKDGQVAATGGKRLLPAYDVFDETRYFEPAEASLAFDLDGKKWGVTICEDIWNAEGLPGGSAYDLDPLTELTHRDIDTLITINASPYSLNKGERRLAILKRLSLKYAVSTIYCNQVGGNDDLLFDGSSMVVDQKGRLICLGKQFEPDFLIWDDGVSYKEIENPWPKEEEAIFKGLVMGTRDYAFKCGFKKALVGLSGGIDSSLVACIAKEALGAENVIGVSMPSPYTSDMSRKDSRKLAQNLGIRFEEIPISELYESFLGSLGPLFRGFRADETEENIQARIRGNLLMALSNKFNALLLTTGNKSEFAMGYCTLYGDLTGGLAILSDLPKTRCYRLAAFINRDGETIPYRVISRPPSAELKPDQTDQDTLPPYEVLDDILESAVERNMGFHEIVAKGHDPTVVSEVLNRLASNEYKRWQAPPGLKITGKAFGYGRRFPIARGKKVY